jgi:preprotein translocase subunit SecY
VRPGTETIDYLDWLLTRLTTGGAVYLAVVCVSPAVLASQFQNLNIFFNFGGTGVLILVGVALDTVAQVEAKLAEKQYDANAGPGGKRVRGRRQRLGQGGLF